MSFSLSGSLRIASKWRSLPVRQKWIFLLAPLMLITLGAWGIVTDLTLVSELHEPEAGHLDQQTLKDLVAGGDPSGAFFMAFETGDSLFETSFNALDGVGANVGQGQRFTRVPRADLTGFGEWANHTPSRATGPNAQNCTSCHNLPAEDGAGSIAGNVHRDPLHSGALGKFIQRNTPHVFSPGSIQRLAEEMTDQLIAIRENTIAQACASGGTVTNTLVAKGISFGTISVKRTKPNPCKTSVLTGGITGVATDLIVRPFQWKGSVLFIRDFNRGAAHNELGMQADELVGDGVDGDFDSVFNEMSVGDQTSLAVYLAAQPRPTTKIELASLNLIDSLSQEEIDSIQRGAVRFAEIGCNTCHVQTLTIENPIFSEPSQNPNYRDVTFPGGQDPISRGVDPAFPITFDLTADQPDNQIKDSNGNVVYRLGSLRKEGVTALVDLYGDLKRHDLGSGLAESIDEVGTGASVFLTENLWGVGTTAPYLHDGRATTLTEAILEHGGEAFASQTAFKDLPLGDQQDVLTFLNNLVLFKLEEE